MMKRIFAFLTIFGFASTALCLTPSQQLVLFSGKPQPLYFDFTNSATQVSSLPWFAFSGGTNGTVTNLAGNIVAATTPRFDYTGGTSNGLLIEESRTNLLLQSSNLNSAAWVNSALSITTNGVSPDGTANANTINEGTASSGHLLYNSAAITTAAQAYVTSIYVQAGTGRYISIQGPSTSGGRPWITFDTQTQAIQANSAVTSSGYVVGSSGWYRVWMTSTAVSSSNSVVAIATSNVATAPSTSNTSGNSYTGTSLTILVYGFDCEAGAFPTSYIPTTTATVTRAADVVQIIGPALACLRGNIGSVVIATNALPTGRPSYNALIGTSSIPPVPLYIGVSPGVAITLNNAGSALSTVNNAASSPLRAGVAWSPSGRNISLNGGSIASDTNLFSTTATSIFLGSISGTQVLGTTVNQIACYPNTQLSNTKLRANTVAGALLP